MGWGERPLALAVARDRCARAQCSGERGRGRGGQRSGPRRGLGLRTLQLEGARLGGELGVEGACRAAWREVVVGAGGTMQKDEGWELKAKRERRLVSCR